MDTATHHHQHQHPYPPSTHSFPRRTKDVEFKLAKLVFQPPTRATDDADDLRPVGGPQADCNRWAGCPFHGELYVN